MALFIHINILVLTMQIYPDLEELISVGMLYPGKPVLVGAAIS